MRSQHEHVRPLSARTAWWIFAGMAAVLLLCTRLLIPFLARVSGAEVILFWFLVSSLLVFLPLLAIGRAMLRREGYRIDRHTWTERLRFRRLNRGDLLWATGALVAVGAASGAAMAGIEAVAGGIGTQPPWMALEPVSGSRLWVLAAWLPYWVLNIMGEEVFWRGVLLPRQEAASGSRAWLLHGCGWALFHVAFGWQLLLTMLPLLLVLPYVVQRRRNSWIGVILHAGLNGPSFVAIAFGAL